MVYIRYFKRPLGIERGFWSTVPLPKAISVAPFIYRNTSLSVIKVLFQYKTSFPSVVKFSWLGLNVFQYPNKILLVGPKGLQELEFNPHQCLFLLSAPIKRRYVGFRCYFK